MNVHIQLSIFFQRESYSIKINFTNKLNLRNNNMMKDLDKLQEVNKELREKILVKEKEFDGHKIKITEMMNYISINSKTEDLKKKKYMDTEMTKMKVKEAAITKDIERLNEALRSNIKALRRGWLWS